MQALAFGPGRDYTRATMRNRRGVAQVLVVIGNIALFYLAYGHWQHGLPSVSKIVADANAPRFFAVGMKVLWVLVSWHWIVFGLMALVASFGRSAPHRAVLSLCGIAVLVDAAATFAGMGWFRGNELMFIAAIVFLAASVIFPFRENRSEAIVTPNVPAT